MSAAVIQRIDDFWNRTIDGSQLSYTRNFQQRESRLIPSYVPRESEVARMHDNGSSVESVQEFRVAMVDHWMDVKNRLKMRILSFQFQEAGHTDLESRKNTTFTIITLNVFVGGIKINALRISK